MSSTTIDACDFLVPASEAEIAKGRFFLGLSIGLSLSAAMWTGIGWVGYSFLS